MLTHGGLALPGGGGGNRVLRMLIPPQLDSAQLLGCKVLSHRVQQWRLWGGVSGVRCTRRVQHCAGQSSIRLEHGHELPEVHADGGHATEVRAQAHEDGLPRDDLLAQRAAQEGQHVPRHAARGRGQGLCVQLRHCLQEVLALQLRLHPHPLRLGKDRRQGGGGVGVHWRGWRCRVQAAGQVL